MNASKLRKQLHQYLDDADPETLQYVHETIVQYRAKTHAAGVKPMSQDEFLAMIEEAEKNIREGKVFTQEEVETMLKERHAKI